MAQQNIIQKGNPISGIQSGSTPIGSSQFSALPNVDNAIRKQRVQYEKAKSRVRQYEKDYPATQSVDEEITQEKMVLDTGFTDRSLLENEKRSVGAGAIYDTSSSARDDRKRVQYGMAAKGVVSDKWVAYDPEEITVVDLKDADQFFGNVDIYADLNGNDYTLALISQEKMAAAFQMPFLMKNTSFLPFLPPNAKKNMSDYLSDIKRYGIGTQATSLNQCLGQATNRAHMTINQTTLNQAFFLCDSQFYAMTASATGDPKTTVEKPRIALFYKKFLDTDPCVEDTIPGGRDLYDNRVCGTRAEIEELMKLHCSTLTFGERAAAAGINMSNGGVNMAFQNMQISDDVYEMIKHTMFASYINLITCIADDYMMSGKWEENCVVGKFAGYPPGLIMPCHIHHMMDASFDTTDAAKNPVDLFHNAWNGNAQRASVPAYRAALALRNAFLIPFNEMDQKGIKRLHKDGYEYINCQTPNKLNLISEENLELGNVTDPLVAMQEHELARMARHFEDPINANGLPFMLSAYGRGTDSNGKRANTDNNAWVAQTMHNAYTTILKNQLIMRSISPYIASNLNPTGSQLFQAWDLNEVNIYKPITTSKTYHRRNNANMMNKDTKFQSKVRRTELNIQGPRGTIHSSMPNKRNQNKVQGFRSGFGVSSSKLAKQQAQSNP